MTQRTHILVFWMFCLVTSGFVDTSRIEEIECSIVAILSDRIEESESCNLKHLLKNDPLFKPLIETAAQHKKRSAYEVAGVHTCAENEPCRVGRFRSCLCQEDFVCDRTSANKDVHLCVKLGYLAMFGV
uniref:Cocaine- and amphetamine-regulated transcript protein n=1 Tax=Caenorhabditis japonica TaxID=281687 RepID=A0A8R1I0G4_CAEJA